MNKLIKLLLVSGIIALGMILPTATFAQGQSDSWFKETDNGSGNRSVSVELSIGGGGEGSGLTNQGYGEPAPLGGGLLLLMSLGAGYAVMKRNKTNH